MNEKELRERVKTEEVNWYQVSSRIPLSVDFIREFHDKVKWNCISWYQVLPEDFIREFQDKVDWCFISMNQVLSEDFIREFQDKVDWWNISFRQTLSESFIREFKDRVFWSVIGRNQVLSDAFYEEFTDFSKRLGERNWRTKGKNFLDVLKKPGKNCWVNKDKEFKRQRVLETRMYDIDGDDIIAYKSTRDDGYSVYRLSHQYKPGETYTDTADYNADVNDSFGLSAWTKEGALSYYDCGKLFKVKIHLDDLAALVSCGDKLRATRLTVIEELENPTFASFSAGLLSQKK